MLSFPTQAGFPEVIRPRAESAAIASGEDCYGTKLVNNTRIHTYFATHNADLLCEFQTVLSVASLKHRPGPRKRLPWLTLTPISASA